jgi:hypothetical protein
MALAWFSIFYEPGIFHRPCGIKYYFDTVAVAELADKLEIG